MKRRLQVLAVCAFALLAVRMMAQDTGGAGAGGDTSGASGDASGAGSSDTSGPSTDNGGTSTGGAGTSTGNGNGTSNGTSGTTNGGTGTGTSTNEGNGNIPAPAPGGEGTQGGSTVVPSPPSSVTPPGSVAPVPGATPAPTPSFTNFGNPTQQGATQAAPVTFSLPGGYGTGAPSTLTLGQGRLARPPITFTTSVSFGYDSNIFDADSHPSAAPTPVPAPTPPLEERIVGFRITPPFAPTPIIQTFRPKASPTPKIPQTQTLGVIGSPVATINLGAQVQKGSPRTVLTMDLSGGADDYFNRPGNPIDYTGSFDAQIVHRLTPRLNLSLEANATYQQTPNFALLNAPTNNSSGGSYLNGSIKANASFSWTKRISTITSDELDLNVLNQNPDSNLIVNTIGNQFRYAVSARNTITVDFRYAVGTYPDAPSLDNTSLYYLLGLDSFISNKLRNTFSFGIQNQGYTQSQGAQTIPYLETATTLFLPRGGSLVWTNRVGADSPGGPGQTAKSYRTSLTFSQPLSTKLVGSLSIAYNYFQNTDLSNSAGSYTQNQFQGSASLGYNVTPRLSLSLTYTLIELLSSQLNSSYDRDQIFLAGNYLFK